MENMGKAHISVNNVISFNKEVRLNTRIHTHTQPLETHKHSVLLVLSVQSEYHITALCKYSPCMQTKNSRSVNAPPVNKQP